MKIGLVKAPQHPPLTLDCVKLQPGIFYIYTALNEFITSQSLNQAVIDSPLRGAVVSLSDS